MQEGEKRNITVTFLPQGLRVRGAVGEKLLHVARHAGMEIDTPCGGQGTCGGLPPL